MARLWRLPGRLALLLLAAGAGLAYTRALSPGTGFGLFLAGALLAGLTAPALAGAAAFASATGRSWRAPAVRGAVLPLLVTLPLVLTLVLAGRSSPVINDVSTDLDDPPRFPPGVGVAPGTPADPGPPAAFRPLQQAAYPELEPLETGEPPAQAFERALAAARAMGGWKVTRSDREQERVVAVATSAVFHFEDDIVIRVRPSPGGSRIDLRSRSRLGRGDLGANAARILAYQERFRAMPPAR